MILILAVVLVLIVLFTWRFGPTNKAIEIPRVVHKVYIQHDNTFGSIPSEIKDAHESWVRLNPGYEIRYYNGKDCENYLLKHFGPGYLRVYKQINAYAGKVNFMRACIVYNDGGWYSDWKQVCLKPLDELQSIKHSFDWVSAYDSPWLEKKHKRTFMMTAFFGAVPKHPLAKRYVDNIVNNVETKHYGDVPLDTTGPGCFGKSFDEMKLNTSNMLIGRHDRNFFKFSGIKWVQQKCEKCTKGQDWKHGNNYNVLWKNKTYYS